MAKIEPFERYTERYEQWFEHNRMVYESELEALQTLLLPCERGLEIGVGTGRFAAPLGIHEGVEPSRAMTRIARRRGVNVVYGTAESLPFKAEQFDLVLMVTTVCFVDDLERAFSEAHRVLKHDGYILIGMVDRESPLGQEYQRHKAENVFYREAHFYSTAEILAALERTGFKEFVFSQTIFRPLPEITSREPVWQGHDEGSFVAIRGKQAGPQQLSS